MVTGPDRRGQLILVGAIVIALLVVGITIIVNTVLFVENTSTDQSTTKLRQAAQVEGELRDAIRATTFRVNHRTRDHNASELRRATERNVTRLTRTMDQQYLASQSLSVSVSVNGTDNGTRLVQAADGDFTHPTGLSNWDPVATTLTPSPRLGWFVLNLNATEPTTGTFEAEVRNESDDAVSVEVERINGSAYEIRSDVDTGGDTTVTCGTRGNRLVLNMRDGSSPTDDTCTFNGTAEIANASTVEFANADQAYGKYAVVIDDTYASGLSSPASVQSCDSPTNPPLSEPCDTPVVWAVQFETDIASESVSRTGEHNVTVYPGGGGP
jgi:hypothetical protein